MGWTRLYLRKHRLQSRIDESPHKIALSCCHVRTCVEWQPVFSPFMYAHVARKSVNSPFSTPLKNLFTQHILRVAAVSRGKLRSTSTGRLANEKGVLISAVDEDGRRDCGVRLEIS